MNNLSKEKVSLNCDRSPSQNTTVIIDSRQQLPGSSHGIYEDHPGLRLDSERLVELQAEIGKKFKEAVKSAGDEKLFSRPSDYTAAVEQLHAESASIEFLQSLSDDLVKNGANGSTYKEGIQMWIDLLMASPLDQFSILPLIPMKIGDLDPPPQQRHPPTMIRKCRWLTRFPIANFPAPESNSANLPMRRVTTSGVMRSVFQLGLQPPAIPVRKARKVDPFGADSTSTAATSNSLRLNSRFNQCRYNILRGQSIPGKELALAKDCSLLGEISLLCRTDVPPGGRETHPAEEKKLCTGTSAGHKPTSTEMVAGKLNSGGGLSSISCLVSGTGFISFKRKHIIRPRCFSVQDLVTQRGCLFSLPFLRMVLLFFWGLFRELFPQLGKYLFSKFGVFGLVVLIEYRDHPVSAKPGVQQPTIAPQHLTKERDRDDIDEIPLHVGIVWEPTWKALPSHGAVKRWMKGRSSRKKPWKSASVLWSPEVFVPFSPDCDDKVMDQLKIGSTLSKNLLDLIMIMGPSTFSTILPKYYDDGRLGQVVEGGGLTTELLLGGLTLRLLQIALNTIWLSLKSETQSPHYLPKLIQAFVPSRQETEELISSIPLEAGKHLNHLTGQVKLSSRRDRCRFYLCQLPLYSRIFSAARLPRESSKSRSQSSSPKGLGADEAFFLSSRSALAPDLELAVLGLRPGFFLESLPFFLLYLGLVSTPPLAFFL
ncbi:ATP synthase subunit a [Sesamum alatum]|uniref:ATP synthase subunit a n=1 Tax=Sesamum alatum TaxID=300844 RepID=A0AAE2C7V1_9LAMI|nr:ATP synthase subunit a [Sesamum alatum]